VNFKDANSLDAPADRGGLGVSAEGLARGVRLWPVDPADASPDAVLARVIDVAEAPTDGPPVVFLHGLVGLNDHWEGVVQRVRDGLRCTLFELPLLRLTGRHCSIEGVTDLTRRFLVEQVGRPALLVGNSFGGHVALRLAIDSPELVRGLVLAGSGGLVERTLVSDIQLRPTRPWLRKKIAELFFDEANMREADVDRALAELTDRHGSRAMVRLARSARKDELRDHIGRIAAPTLLVWGRQDCVTPPEAALGFQRLIRDSRLVWIDRCGHAPMMEAPERFAEELRAFAASLSPSGGPNG